MFHSKIILRSAVVEAECVVWLVSMATAVEEVHLPPPPSPLLPPLLSLPPPPSPSLSVQYHVKFPPLSLPPFLSSPPLLLLLSTLSDFLLFPLLSFSSSSFSSSLSIPFFPPPPSSSFPPPPVPCQTFSSFSLPLSTSLADLYRHGLQCFWVGNTQVCAGALTHTYTQAHTHRDTHTQPVCVLLAEQQSSGTMSLKKRLSFKRTWNFNTVSKVLSDASSLPSLCFLFLCFSVCLSLSLINHGHQLL